MPFGKSALCPWIAFSISFGSRLESLRVACKAYIEQENTSVTEFYIIHKTFRNKTSLEESFN